MSRRVSHRLQKEGIEDCANADVLVMQGVKSRLSTLRKKISLRQPLVKRHSTVAGAGKTPPKSPALASRQPVQN